MCAPGSTVSLAGFAVPDHHLVHLFWSSNLKTSRMQLTRYFWTFLSTSPGLPSLVAYFKESDMLISDTWSVLVACLAYLGDIWTGGTLSIATLVIMPSS